MKTTARTVHELPCPHCAGPADYIAAKGGYAAEVTYGRCGRCMVQWIEGRLLDEP